MQPWTENQKYYINGRLEEDSTQTRAAHLSESFSIRKVRMSMTD